MPFQRFPHELYKGIMTDKSKAVFMTIGWRKYPKNKASKQQEHTAYKIAVVNKTHKEVWQ